jgi:hypothetical protein
VKGMEVMTLHGVLVTRARRAASSATVTTTLIPPGLRTEPCYLRVAQRTPKMRRRFPRHPRWRMRHGLLRSCAMGSAVTLVVPGIPTERPLCITPKMRGASMHTNTPVGIGPGHKIVMELLLT